MKTKNHNPKKEKQEENNLEEEYELISILFYCHENYQKTRNELYYNGYINHEFIQKRREKDIQSDKFKHKREKIIEIIKKRGTKSSRPSKNNSNNPKKRNLKIKD